MITTLPVRPNRKTIIEARRIAREEFGVNYLLSFNSDPKTAKSNRLSDQYLSVILYLAPHALGGHNVCASATPGCIASCLHTAGNKVYQRGKDRARLNRKRLYVERSDVFEVLLYAEIEKYRKRAEMNGYRLAVRLNGTSDTVWERKFPELFQDFDDVQFYDYTKHVGRLSSSWSSRLPSNYDLTLSRSESNHDDCVNVLRDNSRARVSVVFGGLGRTKPFPATFEGLPVHDGDKHDLTFTRRPGWLGLRAKGDARNDQTGFVVWGAE